MGPEPKPCGTRAAYKRHRARGETPCAPCTQANNAYNRARATPRKPRTQPADHIHGTEHGYRQHKKRGTEPCDACAQALRDARAAQRANAAPDRRYREPAAMPAPADLARVIAEHTEPSGTHLLWTGRVNQHGTPVWYLGPSTFTATRLAWVARHGELPRHRVERTCGEPRCVSPDHLTDRPSLAHRARRAAEERLDALYAAITRDAA